MKFLLFLGLVCLASGTKVRYDDYKVYRVQPTTENQVNIINSLQEKLGSIDFWKRGNRLGEPMDIMVGPKEQAVFERTMKMLKIESSQFINNVQQLADDMRVENSTDLMTWTAYHTLDSINAWLNNLAKTYSSQVTVVTGGTSYEKRSIKGVKIAFGKNKKVIVIEGGIHAREWISPATVNYLINEILTSTDAEFRKIAESFEWHIFPVVNVDGYEFTHTTTRLWRKTRQPYDTCYGADPNRNWNAHWMEVGSSAKPCDETYGGPNAFSEPEILSFSNYISTVGSKMAAYIAFHSYGQYLLLPYGHSTAHLDNYEEAMAIGNAGLAALKLRYGTKYTIGNIAEAIYKASGGSIDWVKQEYQTPLVYAFESRDKGTYGFLLPTSQIIPNALETMDALKTMLAEGENYGYYTLG